MIMVLFEHSCRDCSKFWLRPYRESSSPSFVGTYCWDCMEV